MNYKEKHDLKTAAFGGHIFLDLFLHQAVWPDPKPNSI